MRFLVGVALPTLLLASWVSLTVQASPEPDRAVEPVQPSASEQPPATEPPESIWQSSARWALDSHQRLSTEIDSLARSLDRFFSGQDVLEEDNSSFLRVRIGTGYFTGDGLVDQSDVKFRLSLPTTQDRFGLIVENAFDADRSLEDSRRAGTFQEDSTDRSGLSAAVQFFGREISHWRTGLDAGIVSSIPLEPFVRFTTRREWRAESQWLTRVRQRISYFHQRFYQSESTLTLEYPLQPDVIYRMETDIEWRQQDDTMQAAQTFNLLVRVDEDNAIDYQLAAFFSSLSHTVVDNYFLSATLRSRLYRDWLFVEWVPEIAFPREDNYAPRPSLVVRLEILFKD